MAVVLASLFPPSFRRLPHTAIGTWSNRCMMMRPHCCDDDDDDNDNDDENKSES